MNLTLVYTFVTRPMATASATDYLSPAKRFAECLFDHSGYRPRVLIVCCGGQPNAEQRAVFDGQDVDFTVYMGRGKDCGAYLFAAEQIWSEWTMCMCSHAWWTAPDALKKLIDAAEARGNGLYGPSASYEVSPHIRTSCLLTPTENLRQYPYRLMEPWQANDFECGNHSFTQWIDLRGLPCYLVTHDGVYRKHQWRTPPNIFRRGDQSNVLVFDRHTEIYAGSDAQNKVKLEAAADGK